MASRDLRRDVRRLKGIGCAAAAAIAVLCLGAQFCLAIEVDLNDEGRLTVLGTPSADDVLLRLDPTVTMIQIDDVTNGPGVDYEIEFSLVDSVHVVLGAGDDRVIFDDTNGSLGLLRPLGVDVADGDNSVIGSTGSLTPQQIDNLGQTLMSLRVVLQEASSISAEAESLLYRSAKFAATEGVAFMETAPPLLAEAQGMLDSALETSSEAEATALRISEQFMARAERLSRQVQDATSVLDVFDHTEADRFQRHFAQVVDEMAGGVVGDADIETREEELESAIDVFWLSAERLDERFEALLTSSEASFDSLLIQLEAADTLMELEDERLSAEADTLAEHLESEILAGDLFADRANAYAEAAGDLQAAAESLLASILSLIGPLGDPPLASQEHVPASARLGCNITTSNTISGTGLLIGTAGNDLINGSSNVDFIFGLAGDDRIFGSGSSDIIFGDWPSAASGADEIHGDDDTDLLFGNGGNDCIHGGDGIDFLLGNSGDDLMHGDAGETVSFTFVIGPNTITVAIELGDLLLGLDGADEMYGDGGFDVMLGNEGIDTMHGGDVIDLMFGSPGGDIMRGDAGKGLTITINSIPSTPPIGNIMFGGVGQDQMWGGVDRDLIFGLAEADVIHGDGDSDLLFGGLDHDTMNGGDGSDLMIGYLGQDVMHGDSDFDLVFGHKDDDRLYGDSGSDVVVGGDDNDTMNGNDGADLMLGLWGIDVMHGDDGIDVMLGGRGNDVMHGDDGVDLMWGGRDDDTMNGNAGLDIMAGGFGDDVMHGDSGLDMMFGRSHDDIMEGNDGLDLMLGGRGDDTMSGNSDPDLMGGGRGVDTIHGNDQLDVIVGGDDGDILHGDAAIDFVYGKDGDDTIYGDDGWDVLVGNDGNDLMYGGSGTDMMGGRAGDDCMEGGDFRDWMSGHDGNDTMYGGPSADLIFGGPGNDCMEGNDGNDLMLGREGDDRLHGNFGRDIMSGGDGNDCMDGGSDLDLMSGDGGSDTILGADGNDLLFGRQDNDLVDGGDGNDWAWGNQGDDNLYGGPGDDRMWGNQGNDNLYGGPGNDLLWGGPGNDNIDYGGPAGSGATCSACAPCVQPPPPEASVTICKWQDFDCDGVRDPEDAPLPGWAISVIDQGGNVLAICVTNSSGCCTVMLPPGVYDVCEESRPGWYPTYPCVNCLCYQDVDLRPGDNLTLDFGNCRPGPVQGTSEYDNRTSSAVPSTFALRNVQPNPLRGNSAMFITFDLPWTSIVTARIFDLQGRSVAEITVGKQYDAGSHNLQYGGRNLASGVYMLRLEARALDGKAKEVRVVQKIVITK